MATEALPAPRAAHRRAFFGFFDADGWTWAGVKAFVWFIFIIIFLGYIPDRAYYFTVNRTIDLGIMFWSPVNLCPAENGGIPCPPPPGAIEPWQGSPAQLNLPAGRTGGAALQIGTHLLYVGGSDGNAPVTTTYTSEVNNGNFSAWTNGPDLPAARTDFGSTTLSGVAYVVGGDGPDGKPTDTVWALPTTGDKGDLGTWAVAQDANKKDLTLPEARSGAAVIAVTDGLLVVGGRGPDGKPSPTVWKSTVDSTGKLTAWVEQAPLLDGVSDAGSGLVGEFVYIWGGTDANGPTANVQVAHFGTPGSGGLPGGSAAPAASGAAATAAPASAAASLAPGATPAPVPGGVQQWGMSAAVNLPAPRTGGANFAANGSLYQVGGSDGKSPQRELYWAVPDPTGNITDGWHHLDVTDLPQGGLAGGAAVATGATVLVIGGQTQGGLLTSSLRANLAPISPFFQLGPVGVVVPALQIPGEIGQQLGYLLASGAAVTDFAVLVILGWVFNNRPKVRAFMERRRNRGKRRPA